MVIETKNKKISIFSRASVDHFVSQHDGCSKFNTDNFVVSCQKCNSIKGSKEYNLSELKYISKERFEIVKKYYKKFKYNFFI